MMPEHRRRWIAALVAVVVGLAALVTTVTLAGTTAQAVDNEGGSPFASFNMQGSDNGSAWTSEIQRLTARYPVVALQEAGSGPPLPPQANRRNFRQIRLNPPRPTPLPGSVTQVIWPGGPNGSNRYVYFLQTDPNRNSSTGRDTWEGGRVNLAMVTDSPADDVRVLENPAYDPDPNAPNGAHRSRPLLGLRFGSTWYWNTHARGGDVAGLLAQVRAVAAADGRDWVMVGDFNLNILNRSDEEARDESLHLRADELLVRTHQPTYIAGNIPSELDYAITHGLPGFGATRPQGGGSDHTPVVFTRTPPRIQAPVPAHTFSSVLATPTGRLLQENPDRSIGIGDARYDNNQTFRMYTTGALTHYLQNVDTGDCIAAAPVIPPDARRDVSPPDARRVAHFRIIAAACNDPRSLWKVSHPEDDAASDHDNGGPLRWQNVDNPGLCLTAAGISVTAAPCTLAATQRWWDSGSSLPPFWRTTNANVRLQAAFLGGWMRRSANRAGSPVYTWGGPRFGNTEEFAWNIQRINPGDNLVRISMDGSIWCLGSANEHAAAITNAVMQTCNDPRGVGGAGQRWLAESYADGSIRYRNEENHLCLLGPDSRGDLVQLYTCEDIPAERWYVE